MAKTPQAPFSAGPKMLMEAEINRSAFATSVRYQ